MFAILVLMAIFTTFITTPFVIAIYKPLSGRSSLPPGNPKGNDRLSGRWKEEFRILACVRGPRDVPSLIRLIESFGTTSASLKVYVMHLIEFDDRPSSIVMVQRVRRNGLPFINRFYKGASPDQVVAAFGIYGQLRSQSQRVRIRHLKGISSLPTMHEDICHVAEEKMVSMVILPSQMHWSQDGDEGMMARFMPGWRVVNKRVMENAKCSVAIFEDRGFGHRPNNEAGTSLGGRKRVGLVFVGGPNDREALEIGSRMAEHPATRVTLLEVQDKVCAETCIRGAWDWIEQLRVCLNDISADPAGEKPRRR